MVVAGLVLGVALMAYLLQDQISLDRIVESDRRLRELIQARPGQSFMIGFLLYVAVSILPGTGGKSVIAGWLFGFWPAFLMVVGALTIAGMLGFSLARYLFRDTLRGFLGLRLARFDDRVQREGMFYLLTLRLLHVPFTLVNYLSGVSEIQLRTFVWTTVVGLVPGTVVLVGLGAGLPSLYELRERGVVSLVSPTLLIALVAIGLLPLGVRWVMQRFGDGH